MARLTMYDLMIVDLLSVSSRCPLLEEMEFKGLEKARPVGCKSPVAVAHKLTTSATISRLRALQRWVAQGDLDSWRLGVGAGLDGK